MTERGLQEQYFPRRFEVINPQILRESLVPRKLSKWICEPKLNGVRAAVFIHGGDVRILTISKKDRSTKNDATENLPELAEAFRELARTFPDMILDGEIISGEGKTERERTNVVSRINSRRPFNPRFLPVTYVPFDLLHLGDNNLQSLPLVDRIDSLKAVFPSQFRRKYNIRPIEARQGKHLDFIWQALMQGYEGVVFKPKNSLYYPGRTKWLKYKFTKEERAQAILNSSTS